MKLLKSLSYSIALLLIFQQAAAQISWQPLPLTFDSEIRCFYVDSSDTTLYVGGNFNFVNGNYTGCVTKIKKDFSLASMTALPPGAGCLSIVRWRGDLYAGGFFLAKNDGTDWEFLNISGVVTCFFPYKGNLLIGGMFYEGFGGDTSLRASIIEYDGTSFRKFQGVDSVIGNDWFVGQILEYKGELIVAGNFDPYSPINPRYKEIVRWTGAKWEPLGNGIPGGGFTAVHSLLVVNDEMYVAGWFRKDFGAPGNSIAKWDGNSWDDMGDGIDNAVYDLSNRGDTLLVAGVFDAVNSRYSSNFAAYTKGKWCVNTSAMDNPTSTSVDFFGDLIVGGGFWNIGPDSCSKIARITSLTGPFYTTAVEAAGKPMAEIKISPNPCEGRLTVEVRAQRSFSLVTFRVMNLLGQQLRSGSFTGNENQISREFDLSFAPSGMYLLEVNIDGERFSKKVVMK